MRVVELLSWGPVPKVTSLISLFPLGSRLWLSWSGWVQVRLRRSSWSSGNFLSDFTHGVPSSHRFSNVLNIINGLESLVCSSGVAFWVKKFPHSINGWLSSFVGFVSGGSHVGGVSDGVSNISLPSLASRWAEWNILRMVLSLSNVSSSSLSLLVKVNELNLLFKVESSQVDELKLWGS